MLDAIHQADALYVNAISSTAADVSAHASLGPVGKACLDAGATALKKYGTQIIGQVAAAAEEEALKVLPAAVIQAANEVATVAAGIVGAVADIVPMVGAVVAIVTSFESQEAAKAQAYYAAEAAAAMSVPVIGSGPNGVASLGDIFSFAANDPSPEKFPLSTLGRAIVGITETDDEPDNADTNSVYDRPTYHAPIVYDGVAVSTYTNATAVANALTATAQGGPYVEPPTVGVPAARRATFKALRLGIAAHGTASASLAPIYMDLLADAFSKGQLTAGFSTYLLGHYFRSAALYQMYGDTGWVSDSPTGKNPMGDGSPGPYAGANGWAGVVDGIVAMVGAWASASASAVSSHGIRLNFSGIDPRAMILSILANPALTPTARAYWKARLAALPSAFVQALKTGWTPALGALLTPAANMAILWPQYKARIAREAHAAAMAKGHLSPAVLATLAKNIRF